jgi:ribosome-associated toxin RatA of RatAB toxin-antitoxin module
MENAREKMIIGATPVQCYAIASSFEDYPSWAQDIKKVQVIRRDDSGRPTEVTYRAGAFGRTTSYTLRYDYSLAPTSLSWIQIVGDITSKLDGSYTFESLDFDQTEVTYELSVELAVPIPGFVKRRAEGRIVHAALRDLKDRVESQASISPSASK